MSYYSSLLFLIPFFRSLYLPEFILFKILLFFCLLSSCLYNNKYLNTYPSFNNNYLLFDQLNISLLICVYYSYYILIILLVVEYYKYQQINYSTQLFFCIWCIKILTATYYINLLYFYSIILCLLFVLCSFTIRTILCYKYIFSYNIILTWIWHISIVPIMYISIIIIDERIMIE